MILYVENSKSCTNKPLKSIIKFHKVVGYKVNIEKPVIYQQQIKLNFKIMFTTDQST